MKSQGEKLALYLREFADCIVLLHTTRDKKIAEAILSEGFIYESQLSHSTDRVAPSEPVEIVYFLFQRKEYGTYTIVIAIPRRTYEYYTRIAMEKDIMLEEVLAVEEARLNDNEELSYRLNPKHIAGYFDMSTGEFVHNALYDPLFRSERFAL